MFFRPNPSIKIYWKFDELTTSLIPIHWAFKPFKITMLLRRTVFASLLGKSKFSTVSPANVSAALVKQLREKSGAPMLECKKALAAEDVNGDLQKALDWLRAKGKARAANFAERKASEGLVAFFQDKASCTVTLLEINSETDFVSRNAVFQKFVSSVADTVNRSFSCGDINVGELMSKKSVEGITVQDGLTDFLTSFRYDKSSLNLNLYGPRYTIFDFNLGSFFQGEYCNSSCTKVPKFFRQIVVWLCAWTNWYGCVT